MDNTLLEPPAHAVIPATDNNPQRNLLPSPRPVGELKTATAMPPEAFFALCLREEMKEIRFKDFGPTPGHNALWDARYWELPKEDDGQ